MIWATVSFRSCFCWLYRASPSLAAKNIINLISVLTIWWYLCVESSLVLLEEGVCYDQCVLLTNLNSILKSRDITLPTKVCIVKAMVFSSGHVWMWELEHKEGWAPKSWCFQTVVLEKTLESPLDCKEIKPVHPKGNQSWIFNGRTDAEAEVPILATWCKEPIHWKRPDAGKDWGQEKGITEYEMVGWHHQLNGHGFEQILGDSGGQRSLACCSLRMGLQSRTQLIDRTATTKLKASVHQRTSSRKRRFTEWEKIIANHISDVKYIKKTLAIQQRKKQIAQSKYGQRIFPKKLGKWPSSTWKNANIIRDDVANISRDMEIKATVGHHFILRRTAVSKKENTGTSLAVQWLRLCLSMPVWGFDPWWGS